MPRKIVHTAKAPKAIGPYSQAVVAGELVFASGQVGLDPESGLIVEGGVEKQAVRALENLGAVLEAAGASFATIVKATIYLKSMSDFQAVNQIYATYVGKEPPARATVEVAGLPKGGLVEIDAIALVAPKPSGSSPYGSSTS
jgi:2-iminobutanoate/2-iminopropanoate deaminase